MIDHDQVCEAAETIWNYAQVRGPGSLGPLFEAAGLSEGELDHAVKHGIGLGLTSQGDGNLISFSMGILFGLVITGNHLKVTEEFTDKDMFELVSLQEDTIGP